MRRNISIKDFYYHTLENEAQKQCYRHIVNQREACSYNIDIRDYGLTCDELHMIIQAIQYDHPEFFNEAGRSSCSSDFRGRAKELYLEREYSIKTEMAMKHRLAEIVEDLKMQCYGLPDIAKEKLIHDYLVDNVEYGCLQDDRSAFNIIGPLIYGRGVCQGIASAFKFLCGYAAGIPCCLCIGGPAWLDSQDEHAWNIIEIDGEPYHIDVTWDLCSDDKDNVSSGYVYFNCTTAFMEKAHTISGIYPACTSDRYNYFAMKGLNAYSKKAMSDMIVRNIDRREKEIAVRCSFEHDEKQIEKSIPKIIKENCRISGSLEYSYRIEGGVVMINARYSRIAA